MTEQPLQFGPARQLFGVLTLPDALRPEQPVVLIPNGGSGHRIGPARLYVALARALAGAGLATLRFDLAGCGDSADGRVTTDESEPEFTAAMDALSARGLADRYVGIGMASGAHRLHRIARVDERIVGAVFLDGYTYRTPRYWVNYGVDRLTQSRRLAAAQNRAGQLLDDEEAPSPESDQLIAPPAAQMKADLQFFIARNMALFYLFTGDLQADYNYREQLTDAFPLLRSYPRLTLRHLPEADHGFSRRVLRTELINLLVDWLIQGPRLPPAPPPGSHH